MGWIFRNLLRLVIMIIFAELLIHFVVFVQYPFIDKDLEQVKRIDVGLDEMSYRNNTLVPELAKKIRAAKMSPDDYIISNFPYVNDYSNYGIRDFWAYPDETILRQSGDCEDFAILGKSVIDKMYKNITVKVLTQPNHAYVSVNNQSVWKNEDEPTKPIYQEIYDKLVDYFDFQNMPLERTIIIFILFLSECILLSIIFDLIAAKL